MQEGSTLELPSITVKSYDNSGITLSISKTDGSNYAFSEVENQVLLLSIKESYDISSLDSPKTKLKA